MTGTSRQPAFLDRILRELVDAGLASLWDPNPVAFRPEHEAGVRPLRRLLRRPTEAVQSLTRPLARNAFLCGCLDYTEKEPIEHLIMGYGTLSGRTTWIEAVQHTIGSSGSVPVPAHVLRTAQEFVLSKPKAELIVFHNHPANWFNALFDNLPLASTPDRRLLLRAKYLQPLMALKGVLGLGGIHYYVGENGFVREFRVPGVLQMLELLRGLGKPAGPPDLRRSHHYESPR